jgi:hypothetical protein
MSARRQQGLHRLGLPPRRVHHLLHLLVRGVGEQLVAGADLDALDAALGELRAAGSPAPEDPGPGEDTELSGRNTIADRLSAVPGRIARAASLGLAAGLLFADRDISAKLISYGGLWLAALIVAYGIGTSVLQWAYLRGDALTPERWLLEVPRFLPGPDRWRPPGAGDRLGGPPRIRRWRAHQLSLRCG